MFPFFAVIPPIHPFALFCLFWAFLFNKYFPPALLLLLHFPALAAPAIFAPFFVDLRPFSPCLVLAPVQKFNAIKQPPFRFRCNSSISFRIVEIWGVEPCLKSRHYLKLFISSTKSGSQRQMLFKLDYFY